MDQPDHRLRRLGRHLARAYLVERAGYEAIYSNMPPFGLAEATERVHATGGRETARRRLMRGENEPAVPSPE